MGGAGVVGGSGVGLGIIDVDMTMDVVATIELLSVVRATEGVTEAVCPVAVVEGRGS